MEKKKLKTYSANFKSLKLHLSLVAALAFSGQVLASGADDDCVNMGCNSFFVPEIIERPEEVPFFRSDRTFYGQEDDRSDRFETISDINKYEWVSFYNWELGSSQIQTLVYKINVADTRKLVAAINGRDVRLNPTLLALKNGLDKYIASPPNGTDSAAAKTKVLASLQYLILAKEVEPLATRRMEYDGWETPNPEVPGEDFELAQKLIVKAHSLLTQTNDTFLINRYRLQVIRLYFYSAQYDISESYFDQHFASLQTSDAQSVKYRFMDYAAGSLYKAKKYGRANYLYSIIFDQFAPMKRTSYFSFHPMEQSDWNETLAMAKNTHEKAVLWQLLGIYADGVTAIEEIFALNPKSELLPLLLVREVNIAEESWTSNQYRIKYRDDHSNNVVDGIKTDLETVTSKRLNAIVKIADSARTLKPYLWNLAAGHLYALAGDLTNAGKYLRLAERGIPSRSPLLQAQLRMTSLFSKVRGMTIADPSLENRLAVELTWIASYKNESNYRAATLNTWILEKLSGLYQSKGDTLRSLMLMDTAQSSFYRSNTNLDLMIQLITQPQNSFDGYLADFSQYSVVELEELKALNLLYAGELQLASEGFEKIGGDVASQELNADPFMIRIKDCHDCDFEVPNRDRYTLVTFAQRMVELSKIANGQDKVAASDANFLLANAYYNMSHYGNGRDIFQTEHDNLKAPYDSKDLSNEPSFKMDLAQKHYELAAKLSSDREFQTKANWMLAKVEHNVYYNKHPSSPWDPNENDINAGAYFKKLKDEFSDTQYYQEIIRECGYFKTYLDQQ